MTVGKEVSVNPNGIFKDFKTLSQVVCKVVDNTLSLLRPGIALVSY